MNERERRVVVAMDDPRLRARVAGILRRGGYEPVLLESSAKLRTLEPTSNVVILETRNDVAALSQLVYELYSRRRPKHAPRIIALLSRDALKRNPKAGWWDIDGQAALDALMPVEGKHLEVELTQFLDRL